MGGSKQRGVGGPHSVHANNNDDDNDNNVNNNSTMTQKISRSRSLRGACGLKT